MKARGAVAAIAAMVACLFGAAQAMATPWLRADSDHFTLYSTLNERDTRGYVRKLETFHTLTNLILGASDSGPQVKFVIYLMKQDDMIKVRPEFSKQVGGVYFNCDEGTSAYAGESHADIDTFDGEDDSLITLFHEYSHYIMFQHARTYYPAWYVEGFAEFLSTADPRKGLITVGEASKMRTMTLSADRWISFERVLNPDFGFAGDKKNDAWEIESFYAQSWLLTHYMLSDSTRAKALNDYFARLAKGEAPDAAWENATGIKVADLAHLLSAYENHMYFLKVPITDYPDSNIQIAPIATEDQAFLFDASLLTTCPERDQGQSILDRLKAQKATLGGNPHFRTALARAEVQYGDPAAAVADMTALTASDATNFEASYLLGRAYYRQAMNTKGDARGDLIDQSRSAFIAAYRINKLNAPNLFYLGESFGDEPGFPEKNALNAFNGAHVLAPGVVDYAVYAAFADLVAGQRDQAAALLSPFVGDPHNRDMAERFKAAIDAIHGGQSASDVMRILSGVSR